MLAWHFTTDKLRDGRAIPPIGEVLRHHGPARLCASGLHASAIAHDALMHAPGCMLHRVRLGGTIHAGHDKLCATQRTILATVDATDLLRAHARWCALQVTHLWDAPAVVHIYLETGDEALREAADVAACEAIAPSSVSRAAYAAVHAATSACQATRSAYEVDVYAEAAAYAVEARASRSAAYEVACAAARQAQRDDFNRRVAEAFAQFELPED